MTFQRRADGGLEVLEVPSMKIAVAKVRNQGNMEAKEKLAKKQAQLNRLSGITEKNAKGGGKRYTVGKRGDLGNTRPAGRGCHHPKEVN